MSTGPRRLTVLGVDPGICGIGIACFVADVRPAEEPGEAEKARIRDTRETLRQLHRNNAWISPWPRHDVRIIEVPVMDTLFFRDSRKSIDANRIGPELCRILRVPKHQGQKGGGGGGGGGSGGVESGTEFAVHNLRRCVLQADVIVIESQSARKFQNVAYTIKGVFETLRFMFRATRAADNSVRVIPALMKTWNDLTLPPPTGVSKRFRGRKIGSTDERRRALKKSAETSALGCMSTHPDPTIQAIADRVRDTKMCRGRFDMCDAFMHAHNFAVFGLSTSAFRALPPPTAFIPAPAPVDS